MQSKKIFAALAFAGVCTATFAADSAVTVYGLLDVGYSYRTDNFNPTVSSRSGFDSGQANGSRIGFRGNEELFPGVSAIFTLEAGVNVDTGENLQNGAASNNSATTVQRVWGRQTWAGLDFSGTKATIGRQYSPIYAVYSEFEPFGAGTVGQANNVIKNVSAYTRVDNAFRVATPYFGDVFGLDLIYSLNTSGNEASYNAASPATTSDKRYMGGVAKLKIAKRFYVFGGYNQAKVRNAASNDHTFDLLGVADFDFARFTLGYENEKDGTKLAASGPDKGQALQYNRLHVGAKVPFGNFALLASYNYSKDKQELDQKAQQYALGGVYNFSKRTDVYVAYARMLTGSGLTASSGYDLGDGTFSNGAGYRSGLSSGLRVRF